MAIKAVKESRKNKLHSQSPVIPENNSGITELILILLYLLVEFIPQMGSIEVMGPQWLYLSILNLISISFVAIKHKGSFKRFQELLTGNTLTIILLALFVWCGLSIFVALNPTESIVVYSRFGIMLISLFSIGTLIYSHPKKEMP